ncbi:MAG: aminoacetone oxidase family FAD-binding enzyme, partial [Catalinimonas sp.]
EQEQAGPVLLTHWGFSGPAVIRLSAWEATRLHHLKYHFNFRVDWVPNETDETLRRYVQEMRRRHGKQQVGTHGHLELPQRLWGALLDRALLPAATRWADLTKQQTNGLVEELRRGTFAARGKTTFKEEFVTAGGVALDAVDLKTFASRRHPGLYFAGEVLDVDGVTGGFNFQAAWTTGYLAGVAAASG